jgi:two-component system, cell cycle response regulator DivK
MSHILVVEDDPVNALLFRMILEKRGGHRVTVTETPEEVLRLIRERAVELLILDVSLAHSKLEGKPVNGVELCRVIKGTPDTAWIPVILATAHAMRGDAEGLLRESQSDDYIAKPITDHTAFVDQVGRHLKKAA